MSTPIKTPELCMRCKVYAYCKGAENCNKCQNRKYFGCKCDIAWNTPCPNFEEIEQDDETETALPAREQYPKCQDCEHHIDCTTSHDFIHVYMRGLAEECNNCDYTKED